MTQKKNEKRKAMVSPGKVNSQKSKKKMKKRGGKKKKNQKKKITTKANMSLNDGRYAVRLSKLQMSILIVCQ